MLTVADRGEGGVKFAKILLTSYVNAPINNQTKYYTENERCAVNEIQSIIIALHCCMI